MKTQFFRLFSSICAAVLVLPASLALGAPQLLLPHDGPAAKAERERPFKSEGHRVQFNLPELKGLQRGDDVELRLLDGKLHTLTFDVLKDEGNGVSTWIGHYKGSAENLRVIITQGPGGSYGTIATPGGQFRLVPGDGFDWLIDMAAEEPHVPPIDLRDDVRIPDVPKTPQPKMMYSPDYVPPEVQAATSPAISKAAPAAVFVDLMVVYTQTYAAALGANLQTRLNFLVSSANTMYADSEVGIVLRLVHHVGVDYSDTATDDSIALNDITPAAGGGLGVFAGIEALRTQYGADMVTFLRNGSSFGGSGVAWTADQPISAAYAGYMYSVVTGCMASCEWVWVHEVAHNMGNAHDRATVAWENGGVAVPPQGSYPYSFGYYSCTANTLSCIPNVPGGCGSQPECSTPKGGTNNFSDVMAYFHATTTRNFKFSNPNVTCAGALNIQVPCGVPDGQANSADAARSMNNNRAAISALRTAAVAGSGSRLTNVSTRGQVRTGSDVMIGGFVIGGSANKTVVVRARGPSLIPFGIPNALANPTMQLVRSSDQATLATNDNWGSAPNAAAITASGFAPGNALESAILMSLAPGAYTAVVSGVGGGTGVGIVEVFEVDTPSAPLANISTRGQVLTGGDVMIGGFTIQGTTPQTVVVRARGPSLIPFGIPNALANPSLQLVRSSDQATLATNDNWTSAANAASITATGFAPSNALESAILITLSPGAYTAIVTGVGGVTGVGIVEVFATP